MKKRIIAAFLAFIMVFAMVVPIFAEDNQTTNSVTVHKILMAKMNFENKAFPGTKGLDKNEYVGEDITKKVLESKDKNGTSTIEAFFGNDSKEINDVYFAWKKGNDYVKAADGNKNAPKLSASGEVETTEKLDEAMGAKTANYGSVKFNTANMKGEFEIVEVKDLSTYKGENQEALVNEKAVPVKITLPLVNAEGVVSDAHVYPKNIEDKPQIDKNFKQGHGLKETDPNKKNETLNAGANYENYQKDKVKVSAELGKEIPYEVKTLIKKDTEYEKLVWKDTMTNGLTLLPEIEIKAVKGKFEGNKFTASEEKVSSDKETDYKITQDDRGFTLRMTEAGLKKLSESTKGEKGKDVEITLTYKAKVNGNAVVDNPEKNDIKLEYGHRKDVEKEPKSVTPQNGKLTVTKTWVEGDLSLVDKNVKVTYTLRNNKNGSYAVTLDSKIINKTFDLGNGVTFKLGDTAFNGTFEGLKGEENWTIEERVAGYNETITPDNAKGLVDIKNEKDNDNPTPLQPTTPEVVVGGKKFVKTNEDGKERLTGAQFYVKNSDGKYLVAKNDDKKKDEKNNLEAAKKKLNDLIVAWNNLSAEEQEKQKTQKQGEIEAAQKVFNDAFKTVSVGYEWKNKDDANVVVLSSDNQGRFEVSGLEYGKYNLEEKTAPVGYAKVSGDITFEVKAGSFTAEGNINYTKELQGTKDAQQVKNKKISIPQTGGIGTVIFTVAGLIIMGAAIYALKKNNQEVDA